MNIENLKLLKMNLKHGDYNGNDIMQAWIAIDELIKLIEWRDNAFKAHPNIDLDIDFLCK